jgi:excinuclease ABC subunit C
VPAAPDLSTYPDQPGIYIYRTPAGKSLDVGKARSIRKRLASYFGAGPKHARTEALLSEFATIDTIVTTSEMEALALENVFIKRHQPTYNVCLKDDKTYPYIKVTTGEDWPRALVTRRFQRDGHSYFGPFLPARTCRGAMKMITRLFQIRTCRIEIDGSLPRPCLYFDMHACLGPCVAGLTNREAYAEAVKDVLLFLGGKNGELRERLAGKMTAAAEVENFEMAAAYRDCLRTVEELEQKQRVDMTSGEDADVFGEFADGGSLAAVLLVVRGGRLLDSRNFYFEGIGDVEPEEFWVSFLEQYYDATTFLPREVHLPVDLPDEALDPVEAWLSEKRGGRVMIRVPRRGAGFDRIRIARNNARENHARRFRKVREAGEQATLALARALGLPVRPVRIECFDVSHFQGAETYASCVVFIDGQPAKEEYRIFRIEGASGDDFAAISEAVARRYSRVRDEGGALPDLLLIDGGRSQLSAALSSLDRIGLEIPAAGIAKREEKLFVPGRSAAVDLPRRNAGLRLVQRARDEAHRFGLRHHRAARAKVALRSPLLDIPGIGPGTVRKLLSAFGGASAVLAATGEALAAAAGKRAAGAILKSRSAGDGESGKASR